MACKYVAADLGFLGGDHAVLTEFEVRGTSIFVTNVAPMPVAEEPIMNKVKNNFDRVFGLGLFGLVVTVGLAHLFHPSLSFRAAGVWGAVCGFGTGVLLSVAHRVIFGEWPWK